MRRQMVGVVDLTTGTIEKKPIPDIVRRKVIGGRGLDGYLLYNYVKPGTDPMGPDNAFICSAGFLGGMPVPQSSRTHCCSKSPLTGLFGSGSMGGYFAPELRFAGFDNILVTGKSEKPVYLYVHDGDIQIRDARGIWGTGTFDGQRLIEEDLGDHEARSVIIGQAGENLVRYACCRTGLKNANGRSGNGCVMGSKNLKAVTARGTMGLEVACSADDALELFRVKTEKILASKASRSHQVYGTLTPFNTSNYAGQIRVRNFETNSMPDAHGLEPETMHEEFQIGMAGCFNCPIHCRHKYIVPQGPRKGEYSEGPEYTTLGAFGTEVGDNRMEMVLEGNHIANDYGFDTLEFGSLVAWCMELYEHGLISEKDTGGLKLDWANEEVIEELMEQVTFRRGLGDILAEGSLRAIERLGEQTRYYNLNIKGMSNLQSDERSLPGFALGISVSTRGADHLRSRPVIDLYNLPKPVLKKVYGFDVVNDYSLYDDKGKIIWWFETYYPIADSLGICRLGTITFSPNRLDRSDFAEMIEKMTGWKYTPQELQLIGERIYTNERLFNMREGHTSRKDDYPSDRFFLEPTPAGLSKNRNLKLDREKFDKMLDENYAMHGWDKDGTPTPETMKRLELDKEPTHWM